MRTLFFLTLSILLIAGHAAADTATITIESRPAVSLIDVVRPLLGRDGGVSAFHDKLVVQGSSQQIQRVRQLVRQLDQAPRRLLIEVRQRGSGNQASRDFGYGIHGGEVRLGQAPHGPGGQITLRETQTGGRGDSLQRVQALDGRPAMIRAGQSVPVYRAHQQVRGNRIVQGFEMHYRDTGSGFLALPRVHGEQVTVEIYQQHERPTANGRFSKQQASTVLSGRLGEWLNLGSIAASDADRGTRLGRHVQTRSSRDMHLDLRIIPID